MTQLKQALNARDNLLNKKNRENAELRNQERVYSRQLQELKNQVTQASTSVNMQSVVDRLNREIASMQQDNEALKQTLNSIKADFEAVQTNLNTERNKNIQEHQNVNKLENILKIKDKDLRFYQSNLDQRDKVIKDLKSQVGKGVDPEEMEQLHIQLTDKENALRNLKRTLEEVQNENQVMKVEGGNREDHFNRLIAEKQRTLDQVIHESSQANSELLKIKDQQLFHIKENLEFCKKQGEDYKNELTKAKADNRGKISELEAVIDKLRDEIQILKNDIQDLERTIDEKDEDLKNFEEIKLMSKSIQQLLLFIILI